MKKLLLFALLLPAAGYAQAVPSAHTTAARYDAMGRVTGTIGVDPDDGGPQGRSATRTTYDGRGLPTKVETGTLSGWQSEAVAPAAWGSAFAVHASSDTTYDVLRRKLTETRRDSNGTAVALTQYSYDSGGRLQCAAQRMNTAAFASLPASACTLGSQGGFGPDRITLNGYDAAGQLLTVTKAYGVTTANGFPATLQQTYAAYSYTRNGKQRNVTDANGNKAELRYDGHDRQVRWVFPSDASPGFLNENDFEAYGWDAAGNRLSLTKRDGTVITYNYDDLNRVREKIVPASSSGAAGYSVHYGYDLQDRQTFARFGSAAGAGIANAFDGFGRLNSTTNTTGGTSRTLSYLHDAGGRRIRVTHPGGTYFNYDYDIAGRTTGIRLDGATATIVSFSYDAAGRPCRPIRPMRCRPRDTIRLRS